MSNPFIHRIARIVRLSDEQRLKIENLMGQVRSLGRRHSDVCEGDPGTVIVVLSGWAFHYRLLRNGRRQITALLLPGDMCDPSWNWGLAHNQAIESLTPISLVRVPVETLRRSGEIERIFENALYWQTRTALEIQREWTVSLGQRTAIERLAHLFCEISTRLQMGGMARGLAYDMPLTQRDLGDILGSSNVHINRILQDLRSSGLIEFRRRQFRILDDVRLAQLAGFNPNYLFPFRKSSSLFRLNE